MTADAGSRDTLTGAYDRACLQVRFAEELKVASRSKTALAVAVFDLDHFKSINDAFGHQRGDQALVECVRRLQGLLRTPDLLFRYGGDEFVLLMPHTEKGQALTVAERLLNAIRATPFPGEPPISASVTMGLAVFPADGETPEDLFARADGRLYAAKRAGRGQVVSEDAAQPNIHPFAEVSRLIEREGALESVRAFLDALPAQSGGVFAITGARGSGRSRFLIETTNLARLRGLAVLSLHASAALRVRSHGALVEALREWSGLPPVTVDRAAFLQALRQRLVDKGNAGLLVTVDDLTELDPDSLAFIRDMFAADLFPTLALAYSTDGETAERSLWLDATLQQAVHLAPLTPAGLRVWVRGALQNEPQPAFLGWLHRETRGLPGLVEKGLAELVEQHLLRQEAGRWTVSPTYMETRLAERLAVMAAASPHNLPAALTRFIGREDELQAIRQRVESGRLLTLLGPGGCGKTRLAAQVAAELLPHFRHGVRFVELAPVLSADAIASALVEALRLPVSDRSDPRTQLLQYLQSKQMVLVLDNFEHLVDGADLVTEILQAAPHVKVLVTSRERLHLPGEALYELGGLPVPREETDDSGREAAAVQLFIDRARLLDECIALTAEQMRWAVRICQLVQGMPLGIELAAAWVRMLSCEEIATGIAQGLDFLATTQPGMPERHRSLRAVFAHSWQGLSAAERQVFGGLSVFRGGFTRTAAAQVTGASPFMLSALLDKSLLRRTASGRYEVHELLRQYAAEAFGDGEAEVQRRHATHYLALAEQAAQDLEGPQQVERCDQLAAEHPNLRAALQWAIEHDEGEIALRLGTALWRFWELRSHVSEGRRWLTTILAGPTARARTAERAAALVVAGRLARRQGDILQGQTYLEESLSIARELGNEQGAAEALEGLGITTAYAGDPQLAQRHFAESLRIMRAAGNKPGMLRVLNSMGEVVQGQGRFAEAIHLWEECLALGRELGNKVGTASTLNNLAVTLTSMGEYGRARACLEECLVLGRELGSKPMTAAVLGNLGVVALIQGDLATADARLRDSYSLAREIEWKIYQTTVLGDLGLLARRRGDWFLAITHHTESLAIAQALGYRRGIAYYLLGMAGAMAAAGRPVEAARLLGAGEAVLGATKSAPDLVYSQESDYTIGAVGAQLDEAAFAAARAEGQALPLEEALTFAAASAHPAAGAGR